MISNTMGDIPLKYQLNLYSDWMILLKCHYLVQYPVLQRELFLVYQRFQVIKGIISGNRESLHPNLMCTHVISHGVAKLLFLIFQRELMQRNIQDDVKHQWWSFLQKQLPPKIRYVFALKIPSYMFDRVLTLQVPTP